MWEWDEDFFPNLIEQVGCFFRDYWLPLLVASSISLFVSIPYRNYLPITDGWVRIERWWFPLQAINLVFHEAGHLILGVLGNEFLTYAGGTLFQLLFPFVCLFHFARQSSPAGIAFSVFWLGINFTEISFYAADAKLQALILISGMTGQEGGGHDWHYMFQHLGLLNQSVPIGQFIFFVGCTCLFFAPFWYGWRFLVKSDNI